MRFLATLLMWLVTTILLAVALPAAWAQQHLVDTDGYAAMAQKAAADPALQLATTATGAPRFVRETDGNGSNHRPGQVSHRRRRQYARSTARRHSRGRRRARGSPALLPNR